MRERRVLLGILSLGQPNALRPFLRSQILTRTIWRGVARRRQVKPTLRIQAEVILPGPPSAHPAANVA
jgi:hypothetical protein